MKEQALDEKKPSPKACLFVAQISRSSGEDSLQNHFSPFGEITSVKLLSDRASRPYAFIQFEEEESALTALREANGSFLDGSQIRVEKARVNCTLFIAKLPRDMSNNSLREMVKLYGQVESVSIIKNHITQKSKGCGFIKFLHRDDAQNAFTDMKTNQKGFVVEWATSRNDPENLGVDRRNIFVGGLNPQLIEESALRQRFEVYGELESLTLVNRHSAEEVEDAKGPSRRNAFAFIRFFDSSAAATAIENENESEWLERRIRVQFCESQELKLKRRVAKGYPVGYQQATTGFRGNSNLYYPPPDQNGMIMMGGVAWYPLPNKGDAYPPYVVPGYNAPWGYQPYMDEYSYYQPRPLDYLYTPVPPS